MKAQNRHIWDGSLRLTPHVGSFPTSQTFPACGKNLHNLSTNYPQELWINAVFYISVRLKTTPPNMGVTLTRKNRAWSGVFHRECHLSTDNRELSTVALVRQSFL